MRAPRPLVSILPGALLLMGAGPRPLALRHVTLDLPGPPAAVIPADLDGDGLIDLLVPLVYTHFEEEAFERVEGAVHVTEVVPALYDRRELRAFIASPDGSYRMVEPPLPLPPSVHSLEPGPAGYPVVALTDEGMAVLRLGAGQHPGFEPRIPDPPVVAGSGAFLPGFTMVKDLDGDRVADLLLPALDGPAIYRATAAGLEGTSTARLRMPGDEKGAGGSIWRRYPIPEVRDVDGDALPDLVLDNGGSDEDDPIVLRGTGGGRFGPPVTIRSGCLRPTAGSVREFELIYFGDLDGDGRAEGVTSTAKGDDDGMKEAKEPHITLRFHRLRADLTFDPHPYQELEAVGYPFGGEWPELSGSGFRDLDGDGRRDLVTFTLDFSLFQILRVLTTKRVGIEFSFHVWSQGGDGRFREVTDLDLSEKIQVDLNDLKLGRFAQFNGDFDGDGRIDFVHLGRGRSVTIHRGEPGCRYPRKPDLVIDLEEEPRDLALVRVRDLDGDHRSDLAVTRLLDAPEPGASSPVKLDLYLSREAR